MKNKWNTGVRRPSEAEFAVRDMRDELSLSESQRPVFPEKFLAALNDVVDDGMSWEEVTSMLIFMGELRNLRGSMSPEDLVLRTSYIASVVVGNVRNKQEEEEYEVELARQIEEEGLP